MGQVRAYFSVIFGEVGLFKWGWPTHSDSMETCYGMSGQAYDPFLFLDLPRKATCIVHRPLTKGNCIFFIYFKQS